MAAEQEIGRIKRIASLSPTLNGAAYNVYVGKVNINIEIDAVVDLLIGGLSVEAFTVADLQDVARWMHVLSEEAGAIGWEKVEPAGGALEYLARSIGRTASFETLTLTGNRFGGVLLAKEVDAAVIDAVMAA